MPFKIPHLADAAFPAQAAPDSGDVDILVAGHARTGVLTGCAVTAQATPNLTVAVAAGTISVGGTEATVTAGNLILGAGVAQPRFDLVVVTSAGVKQVVAGAPGEDPVYPPIPANSVVLAAIYVSIGDIAIGASQIVDKRVVLAAAADTAHAALTTTAHNIPAQIQSAIDALVTDAPGALNTLGEIADALNDDANLAATLTTQINARLTPAQADALYSALGHSHGESGGVPAITVPYFTADPFEPPNIFHGKFWPTEVDLGPFLWRCWCRYDTGAEYWISEGFGGAHAILAGFGGGGGPTGNVWNGVSSTSFSGAYTAQHGEWLLYDVAWDGTYIFVLINGFVVGRFPFAGPRRAQYGDLFIGGSDHSNFKGAIAQVCAWEGQTPVGNFAYGFQYPADRYFSDRINTYGVRTNFNANYLVPGADSYPDWSDGFAGEHHPGAARSLYNGFGVQTSAFAHAQRQVDPTAPFGNQKDVPRTRTFQAPAPVPAGAKIWDSFGRADSIAAFNYPVTMGSTEGGSLGVKPWEHESMRWGIFDGTAFCGVDSAYARVTNDSADMDVRVGRVLDVARGFTYAGVGARIKADRSTGWEAHTWDDGAGSVHIYLNRPDGSTVGNWVANGNWTHLRLVASGTTITVYTGSGGTWTQVAQVTGETQNQAEVGAGLFHAGGVGTLGRYTDFEVR